MCSLKFTGSWLSLPSLAAPPPNELQSTTILGQRGVSENRLSASLWKDLRLESLVLKDSVAAFAATVSWMWSIALGP